ncbi:hypothetical protein HMSSN036_30380 [Paenibacillus macerans]|nr:hypothetical protein HMSSN036_30380 [Paenibacillus macerans]
MAVRQPILVLCWNDQDPKIWEEMKEFNKSAVKSKALGFAFDPRSGHEAAWTFLHKIKVNILVYNPYIEGSLMSDEQQVRRCSKEIVEIQPPLSYDAARNCIFAHK